MEFLKDLFNEELNDEGLITILGSNFERHKVVQKMEEETYHLGFTEWKEERRERLLEKADEILDKYNNRDRFNRLKSIYAQDNILPFIGAGMSMSSGYSGWTAFLYKLREETYIPESELDALINKGEYEEAAQLLYDDMPSNGFNEELENEFYNDKDILGCIQYIPYIFNSKVITTNFDRLLERCYENADKQFKKITAGKDTKDIARLFMTENSILIKLHGEADSSEKRILTKSEYDTNYNKSHTLKSCIETISYNSLLFVGCSLSVDRTVSTMIEIANEKGHDHIPRHYAILPLKDGEDRVARKNKLAEANIFPIWYDNNDDHDECIEALLLKLVDGIREL